MAESKTYTGACHCKKIRFEVTLSNPVTSEEQKVVECNCSVCTTHSYLLAFADMPAVASKEGGLENMKKYNFNTGTFTHYFCTNCGTSMCVIGAIGGNEKIGLNVSMHLVSNCRSNRLSKVRSFDDIDLGSLHKRAVDGKSY